MQKATLVALDAGYRHIDTAQMYGTEKYVGQAIKDSGIKRSEIFLNSKIYNTCYAPNLVKECLEKTLERKLDLAHKSFRKVTFFEIKKSKIVLQTDYLDSWLMHTPWAFVPKDPTKAKAAWAVDENKKPIENKQYDMLETWNAIAKQERFSSVSLRIYFLKNMSSKTEKSMKGLVRDPGVSNFSNSQVDYLIKNSSYMKPSINQVECHPYLNQSELIRFNR